MDAVNISLIVINEICRISRNRQRQGKGATTVYFKYYSPVVIILFSTV